MPVVGGVIDTSTAIIEQIGDSTDILDSAKTYEQMTNIAQTRQMADNYKLNTIRVTHDEGGDSSLNYYVFEGIGDAKDIDYDLNNPITPNDVLENPKKVMELHNKWVKECPEGYLGSSGLYE